jgi:trans-aconitate methyltransferase
MAEIVGSVGYMNNSYVEYQNKYRRNMRESDKATISLIKDNLPIGEGLRLLDIGCHNGNLLYHLRQAMPQIHMTGGDLFQGVIDRCLADQDLIGIDFHVMDLTDLHCPPVDIIVASAVLFRFDEQQHSNIWQRFFDLLRPDGLVVTFDFYNSFRQNIRVIEETETHPEGLVLNFWSQQLVRAQLTKIGFTDLQFQMFDIPIDLELQDPTDPLYTHTRQTCDGKRLQFRGALYQPWCHLVTRKP